MKYPTVAALLCALAGPVHECTLAQNGLMIDQSSGQGLLKMTLYPAPQADLPLKYDLLPAKRNLIKANAAVYYGQVGITYANVFSNWKYAQEVSQLSTAPLDELRKDRQAAVKLFWADIYERLDRASRCTRCEWQLPLGEDTYYFMQQPELNQCRRYGDFLAARARLEIAEERYDDAVHTLAIGYAVGRHLAEGETLINSYIGAGVCNLMASQVAELIQQPSSPNLYWALTRMPHPLINGRQATESELASVYWSFPELRDAESVSGDTAYWRRQLLSFWKKFTQLAKSTNSVRYKTDSPTVLTALCVKGYPLAKKRLVDRGLAPVRVEAMPVGQVVTIDVLYTCRKIRNEFFKWSFVDYWELPPHIVQPETYWNTIPYEDREIIPLAKVLVPAFRDFRVRLALCDRNMAALRVLEAIRMYMATHAGRFPSKLSDIVDVPLPIDPVSGKPFQYSVRGDVATLSGPPLQEYLLHLQIRAGNLNKSVTTEE